MYSETLLYQNPYGNFKWDFIMKAETVWLTKAQTAQSCGNDKTTQSEKYGILFIEGGLDENSVVRNFRITAEVGKNDETHHSSPAAFFSAGDSLKSIQGLEKLEEEFQRLKKAV